MDSKLYLNYYLKTERLEKNLKTFLKRVKLPVKKIKNLNKNSTKENFKKDFKKFFTKKNLNLIERKDKYLFKKFKYKRI